MSGAAPCRAAVALLALLASCADPAIDRGRSPPIVLSEADIVVPLDHSPHGPAFASAIRLLGGPAASNAIRARVGVSGRHQFDAIRAELLAAGLDPARISVLPGPGEAVLFSRTVARMADCRSAIAPGPFGDISQSFQSIAECQQARALAGSLVDPADLASPPAPGLADGSKAASAVLRWQSVAPRSNAAPGYANNGEAGQSGGLGAIPSAAAAGLDGLVPAGAGNPLTSFAPLPGLPIAPPTPPPPSGAPASAE